VKKIARKGGGSGLIRDPDLAARLVETVAAAVTLPVTVKTRLGWCDGSGAEAWCLRLQNAGAQLLTLHGRSRDQGFRGEADWSAIAAVKRCLRIPLIANGDIDSPADAIRCLEITGADGVMVGRGTMGCPWLVGCIDGALRGKPALLPIPDAAGRLALAAEQLQALVASRGDHGLLIARKHLAWTCTGFAGAPQLRHALMAAASPAAALDLLEQAREALSRPTATPAQGSTSGQP
jgi:tRNA-dihydrouridine synthase